MQILDLPNPVSAPIAKTAITQQNITSTRHNWRILSESYPEEVFYLPLTAGRESACLISPWDTQFAALAPASVTPLLVK